MVRSLLPLLISALTLALAQPSLALHARDTPVCGLVGYDLGIKAYNYANDTSLANTVACGTRCQTDSTCKSFAFGNGTCLLYINSVYELGPAPFLHLECCNDKRKLTLNQDGECPATG